MPAFFFVNVFIFIVLRYFLILTQTAPHRNHTKAESTPDLQSKRGVSGTPRFGNGNETVGMRTYRTAITYPDSSLLLTRTPSPITQAS